jgi:hypothetical protein
MFLIGVPNLLLLERGYSVCFALGKNSYRVAVTVLDQAIIWVVGRTGSGRARVVLEGVVSSHFVIGYWLSNIL